MSESDYPTSEHGFYQYWGRFISSGIKISDAQLGELLTSIQWPDAVNQALSQLAARMILTESQAQLALEAVKSKYRDANDAKRDLTALAILLDGHKGPLYKLQAALGLSADWACALAIQEVLPWYTNNARQMIIQSSRPDSVKSYLIKIVNAHADEMRSTMQF